MPEPHVHEHPPSTLSSEDTSLPEREVLTPMGKAKFRNAELETKGYRWGYTKKSDEKMLEIVYLKSDGTTGTIIADLESLFDVQIASKDNMPVCLVTFRFITKVSDTVELVRAEAPIKSLKDINKILKQPGLIDYFLDKAYGRKV